jgi:HicB-like protein involved in pilus formation
MPRQTPGTTPPASGRIAVRMPATLHNELRRMAIEENVSIQALSQEMRDRMIWEGWAQMFR